MGCWWCTLIEKKKKVQLRAHKGYEKISYHSSSFLPPWLLQFIALRESTYFAPWRPLRPFKWWTHKAKSFTCSVAELPLRSQSWPKGAGFWCNGVSPWMHLSRPWSSSACGSLAPRLKIFSHSSTFPIVFDTRSGGDETTSADELINNSRAFSAHFLWLTRAHA